MKGILLKFYMHEFQKHHHYLLYEWLLKSAKKHGALIGAVFKPIASFSYHEKIEEEHFFELASKVSVEVALVMKHEDADHLIDFLKEQHIDLFYIRSEIEYLIPESSQSYTHRE